MRILVGAAVLFVGVASPMVDVAAQVADFEPPLIEHEVTENGSPGVVQEFTASVVDDQSLAEVTLFYRFEGDGKFKSVTMQPIASSSVHTASVETQRGDDRDIEYYIRATDSAGNRVIKGYAFDPLVRSMGRSVDVGNNGPVASNTSGNKRRNLLYIGLGVLAIGAIAAAASSDDGGGSDDNTFTVVLDPP